MRTYSVVSRPFAVLVCCLPLFGSGCMHRSGCTGCSTGASRPAPTNPPMSRPVGSNSPGPATTAIARQATCPVTGEKLGSMGRPVPVPVKGETIYVCCQGCVDAVLAEPDKYLAIVHSDNAGAATSRLTKVTQRERPVVDPGHVSGGGGHSH